LLRSCGHPPSRIGPPDEEDEDAATPALGGEVGVLTKLDIP
jgi:hypothetical protein